MKESSTLKTLPILVPLAFGFIAGLLARIVAERTLWSAKDLIIRARGSYQASQPRLGLIRFRRQRRQLFALRCREHTWPTLPAISLGTVNSLSKR